MRATACAALLALVLSACAGIAPKSHVNHSSGPAPKGIVQVSAGLYGGPLDPKTHRQVLNGKPVRNVRISVVGRDGRHWHGRTTAAGIRTFTLPPGRYVVSSDWCGRRHLRVKVLPERILPVRYACPVP
jgi:hypothetical protein